jgi:anti-sigma factor RsiW
MYESASGERYTVYTSRTKANATQMRYAARDKDGAMFWAEDGVGYVVSGPTDKEKLMHVARLVYDQNEKAGL